MGLVKAHYSETIEITLNQQPEGYDEKLLLTGDDAGFARDSLGCYLTGNLAVDVYWGPSGAVQVVRRVTF